MNSLIPEIVSRRARRALADQAIPADILERILKAAVLAPSCSNNQPWRILVLEEKTALVRGRDALTPGNYWAKKAPLLIIIFTRKEDDCVGTDLRDYALFDCGLAAQNLMLQATREGLIAHPMAGFDAAAVKSSFNLPQNAIPIVAIALGFPGDESGLSDKHKAIEDAPQSRKPTQETVFYNGL